MKEQGINDFCIESRPHPAFLEKGWWQSLDFIIEKADVYKRQGLVPVCTGLAQVPWTTPLVISGYLATGSIAGSILQIVCLIVVVLIWLPFVRIADNQLIKEEAALENKGGSVQETI